MTARRHTEPRDSCIARLHRSGKTLQVVRFLFGWTLPCLFDRYDVSPLTGDDWAHSLRPAPAAEDNVAWRVSHGGLFSRRPGVRLSRRSQLFLKKCESFWQRLPAHRESCGHPPDCLRLLES